MDAETVNWPPERWQAVLDRVNAYSGGETYELSVPFRFAEAMTRCGSTVCHKRIVKGDEVIMVLMTDHPDEPATLHIACAREHGFPINAPTAPRPAVGGPMPWREALDGKLAILGALATTGARRSLLAYFMDNPAVAALPTQAERIRAAQVHVESTVRQTAHMVRRLESFYVSPEIRRALMVTTVDAEGQALALGSPISGLEAFAFDTERIPTPDGGLLWLPPDPSAPRKPNGRQRFDENVRAIVFTPAQVGAPLSDGSYRVDHPEQQLAVISFVDAEAAGWDWAEGARLVPFIQPPVPYGATVIEMLADVQQRYPDDVTDRAYHGYPFLLMGALFGWMQGRILKQGRVEPGELDRATRRRAERADVAPVVRVVEWRKAEYAAKHGGSRAVDWTCQWPVTGHMRTLANGRRIPIRPYVKGPKGKPFRVPQDRVNVVDR